MTSKPSRSTKARTNGSVSVCSRVLDRCVIVRVRDRAGLAQVDLVVGTELHRADRAVATAAGVDPLAHGHRWPSSRFSRAATARVAAGGTGFR